MSYTLSYSKETLKEFKEMMQECDEKIKGLEIELEKAKKSKKRMAIYFYCSMLDKTTPENIIKESIKKIETEIQNLKDEREALNFGFEKYIEENKSDIKKEAEIEDEKHQKLIDVIKNNACTHTKNK
ncbi:hypothetical protein ACSXDQ_15405 (plasmid) [Clostridium perfringens]